jgi:hypothetical protein
MDAAEEECGDRDRQGQRDGANDGEFHEAPSIGGRVTSTLARTGRRVVGREAGIASAGRVDFGRPRSTFRSSRHGRAIDAESGERR